MLVIDMKVGKYRSIIDVVFAHVIICALVGEDCIVISHGDLLMIRVLHAEKDIRHLIGLEVVHALIRGVMDGNHEHIA